MLIIILAVLAIIIALLIPKAQRVAEPFDDPAYIQAGMDMFNPLNLMMDITQPNFTGSTNAQVIADTNAAISAASQTVSVVPDSLTGTHSTTVNTGPHLAIAQPSILVENAKRCEANKGRNTCSALGTNDLDNCGVCLKGGESYINPGDGPTFIGGMYIYPKDREAAIQDGIPIKPTVGRCPPEYFFVNKNECEKAANRLDCDEIGNTGGFDGGKTIEGNRTAVQKCAQVPTADKYIYDPKNRKSPVGSGICKVFVFNTKNEQVGYGISDVPGVEFIVPIRNVAELDSLRIQIAQEVPYRPSGKKEEFLYVPNPTGTGWPARDMSTESAAAACNRIGSEHASLQQLEEAQLNGAQACTPAVVKEGSTVYPMQGYETRGWCGHGAGIQRYSATDKKGYTWCYGIKPPTSTNMLMMANVFPWFSPIATMSPSQEGMAVEWSKHGYEYQAPFYRAVLLQWESVDGSRRVAFEPSITKLNDVDRTSAGLNNIRKFGTFSGSKVISAPRYNSSSKIMSNTFWFWSNLDTSQTITVNAKVPGTFLDAFYPEDRAIASSGPLITQPETMKLLRTSPCFAADQKPGAYSIECLSHLFVAAGGNLYSSKIAKDGLDKLNQLGDMNAISEYLSELYATASKGIKPDGTRASVTEINNAAVLLLGVNIITPCEDIYEGKDGLIALMPKVGAVDAECLDFLWKNTGNDRSRASEDRTRNTTIRNTYTTIGDRYSGLRNSEGNSAARAAAPFAVCQPSGTLAPIGKNGVINETAVALANSKGSIDKIQAFYDQIHKTANFSGNSAATAKDHIKALEQCYGVFKAGDVPVKPCITGKYSI